jgi:hypothetical protein
LVRRHLAIGFERESAAQSPERLYRDRGLMTFLVVRVVAFFVVTFMDIPPMYRVFHIEPTHVAPLWKF